jgi:hypothetical protein
MSRPRLQFRLSTLLWLTLAVVCLAAVPGCRSGETVDAVFEQPQPPFIVGKGNWSDDPDGKEHRTVLWSNDTITIERRDKSTPDIAIPNP